MAAPVTLPLYDASRPRRSADYSFSRVAGEKKPPVLVASHYGHCTSNQGLAAGGVCRHACLPPPKIAA